MHEKLMNIFVEALEIDASTLLPETKISDVPEWTSLAWLTIMALLDENFGIQLDSKAVRSFSTVQSIIDYVTPKIMATADVAAG